jgi:hypothetical protein
VNDPAVAGLWPALPEAQFLIDAVVDHDQRHGVRGDEMLGEGLLTREFVLALAAFERLERVDQGPPGG